MSRVDSFGDHGYGVIDPAEVGDERAAKTRGEYLAGTTDLNDRQAESVGWKELGNTDRAIAREMDFAPATVTGWLDRARAQYGLSGAAITPLEDRRDLDEVRPDDLNPNYSPKRTDKPDELSAAVREQYRLIAVEHPGVVPDGVLEALAGDAANGGDRP